MKNMLRAAILALFLAVFLVTDSVVNADHSWGNYHWARTSNPAVLTLGDNLTNVWDSHLVTAEADWEQSQVLSLSIVAGQTDPRRCRAATGKIEVCNDTYGFNGWLGIAGISVSGSHIVSSYVKLNDSYFNTATYNTPAWRNLVMCQEVGHAFGLDHQDENFNNANLNTCMDYTNDPLSNQHPNQHDYQQLLDIYNHTDGGGGSEPPCRGKGCNGKNSVDFDTPGEWGRVIARDNFGRPILYVRDFGNGRKQFTHIFPIPTEDEPHEH